MTATAISFKSVGKSSRVVKTEREAAADRTPIGLKTPLRISQGTFATNSDLLAQIRDNLRNLIRTNHGERLVLHDFGANLNELAVERLAIEDYDQEVASRIANAVSKWMPYVSLDEMLPLDDQDDERGRSRTSTIPIRRYLLTYSVPTLGSTQQSIEIVIGIA